MPDRVFKSRERKSSFRDAKLIVIATEGTQTEKKYLVDLAADDKYRNPKVHVEILERETTASSPEHIINELDKFRKTYSLKSIDELWLVIDLDRWGSGKLSLVSTQCSQKNYSFAVSNPCFEIWLLLHIASLDNYSYDDINGFEENKKHNSRTRLESELVKLLGDYNKSNIRTTDFIPHVEKAIERAIKLDKNPEHSWPNHLGTRVYLLVESIINSSRR